MGLNYLQQRFLQKLSGAKSTTAPKEAKPIAQVSEKKKAQLKVEEPDNKELIQFFKDRHKEMTGFCANCGGKSTKGNIDYWKFSIAHILPKAHFESVKSNAANFIELCYFDNSCHSQMDNSMLEPPQMKCWDTILERFLILYPLLTKEEKRRLPDYFKQEVKY